VKYLALLLVVGLAAGNGQMWPMGEQYTREIVLKIPRPALPSPPCQFYLDHGPWDADKLPQIPKSKGRFPVEASPTSEE
jgi:hypothetical protein